MKTLKTLLLLCLVYGMSSCADKSKKENVPTEEQDSTQILGLEKTKVKIPDEVYFKANGTEPFWGLEISEAGIQLTQLKEAIDTLKAPYSLPIQAMDANVKTYKIQTQSIEMGIQISMSECINAMSGEAFPYRVTVDLKTNTETETLHLEGCGRYITDYRLNDIWVLEKMNGKRISEEDFGKELPSLEINSTANSFSGYAGCNRMTGALFYEKGLLRFTKVATTLMMCTHVNKENEFLKALQSSTGYEIGNNRLTLLSPDGTILVFKKTD